MAPRLALMQPACSAVFVRPLNGASSDAPPYRRRGHRLQALTQWVATYVARAISRIQPGEGQKSHLVSYMEQRVGDELLPAPCRRTCDTVAAAFSGPDESLGNEHL